MRLRLLGVGRPKDPVLGGLHDRYSERIQRLGTDYSFAFVPEVAAGGRYSDEHVRERESQALRVPRDDKRKREARCRGCVARAADVVAAPKAEKVAAEKPKRARKAKAKSAAQETSDETQE